MVRVILASVVVHAIVLAVVWWEWDAWLPPVTAIVETPHVEVVEVSVQTRTIDVAMIDDVASTSPSPAHVGRVSAAHVGGASGGEAGPASTEPTGTTAGKKLFTMRGPELHPNDAALEHIADAPGHTPVPVIPSKRLDDAPGGRAVIHDTTAEITVDRDGTAHVHDNADFDAHFDVNPLHILRGVKDFGRSIAAWAEDPEAGTRFGTTQDLPQHLQASEGACDHYGAAMCDDPSAPGANESGPKQTDRGVLLPVLHGNMDITSYLMKKFHVGDAYAARKLKALDDTRLERVERGAKFKSEQLAKSAQMMQDNLQRLWSQTPDLDERKAVLFELWDECVEGDGEVGAAGDRAREMVIGWIRAQLPSDKPGAFSPREVDALDHRRTSKQHFVPY